MESKVKEFSEGIRQVKELEERIRKLETLYEERGWSSSSCAVCKKEFETVSLCGGRCSGQTAQHKATHIYGTGFDHKQKPVYTCGTCFESARDQHQLNVIMKQTTI